MRMFQAYGLQTDVIDQLNSYNCEIIRISSSKKMFVSPFKDWQNDTKVLIRNFGHGYQVFMPIKYMKEIAK